MLWPFEFVESFCFSILSVSIYYRAQSDIRVKSYCRFTFLELPFSISSVSISYGTQSNIRVKSYCRLTFLSASVFNFKRLDILRDTIGHPSQKLLSFEFSQSLCFQFRASRYITGLNQTFVHKVIVISICSEFLVSILIVSIYDLIQSDIRVKSYCR